MKPHPVNVTREFGGAQREPLEGWPADKENVFDDPEDKTPIAPAPSLALLANAGAPWYLRHRYWLGGGAGISMIGLAFVFGMRASAPPAQPPPAAAAPSPL